VTKVGKEILPGLVIKYAKTTLVSAST